MYNQQLQAQTSVKPLQSKPTINPLTKPMTAEAPKPLGTNLTKPMVSSLTNNATTPTTKPMSYESTTTPGGLNGNINNQRYDNPNQNGSQQPALWGIAAQQANGGQYGGGASTSNSSNFGNFDEFRDSALSQAMRGLQPQIDANNARFEQQMVGRGIQPGTEQYDTQRANFDRGNNDMLTQANYGAQQQGLAAQNQAWNQDYQYDALANALSQTRIGANASMANAQTGANASMYNSDNSLQAAQMANQLGYSNLNEDGRQFDINDIYRNQQLDLQGAMGFGNLDLAQQGQDLQNWQANQGAQNNWWNQMSGFLNNAPGTNFQPTGNYVGNQMQAGQNQQNNTNQSNAALASLLGAGIGAFSDKRLKENIVYTDTVSGVDYYDFDYIDKSLGAHRYNGVMAQDVMSKYPNAVYKTGKGFYKVNYKLLPRDMKIVELIKEVA